MDKKTLAALIDHTMLRPEATEREVAAFVETGAREGYASVCVPPCHVALAKRLLSPFNTPVSTVAGFPLGFHAPGTKLVEARAAFDAGASEIDVVMNVSMLKSAGPSYVAGEISSVVRALPEAVIKVIIEACYLTDLEKLASLEAAVEAGAAFVKTSTGFARAGASVHDVALLSGAARGRVLVKASGGIKTTTEALSMIAAGAARIGTSSGQAILAGLSA